MNIFELIPGGSRLPVRCSAGSRKQFAGPLLACTLFMTGCAAHLALAGEDSSVGSSDDCSDVSINYTDAPHLTRQEKTRLMDQALLDSLNRYERCQARFSASGGGSSGAQGAGGAGGRNDGDGQGEHGDGSQDGAEHTASTASSEMKGTDVKEPEAVSNTGMSGAEQVSGSRNERDKAESTNVPGTGRVPGDIPPADNDSVLEEQIRQAAMNEKDPVVREKLWNEYRKYKGLPRVSER